MRLKALVQGIWQNTFVATFQKVEKDKSPHGSHQVNSQVIGVFIVVALSLVLIEYASSFKGILKYIETIGGKIATQGIWQWYHAQVNPKWISVMYWAIITIIAFLLIPLVYIKWGLNKPWSDFGWQFHATRQDLLLYASCFLVMFPLVVLVSSTKMFQLKYPFYQPQAHAAWVSYFLVWELVYLIQFVAVEFFFRGFMLHGIKRQLGAYSLWVAMLPYCMIHFRKPLPETLGAIIAGLVLGVFSLKNNSIWLGVLLHYSVAITMDLLALWHKGWLF